MSSYALAILPSSYSPGHDEVHEASREQTFALQTPGDYAEASQRQLAVKKLVAVRQFARQDCEPCWLLEGLYIGSIGAARNLEGLRKRGVTHVLNASPIVPCFHRAHFRYMSVPVYDDTEEDISRFFPDATRFIARGRRKGAVLVHCYAGQSRSVALVIAYLCAYFNMSLAEAYNVVVAARPTARPNAGFMHQLAAYEQRLRAQNLRHIHK